VPAAARGQNLAIAYRLAENAVGLIGCRRWRLSWFADLSNAAADSCTAANTSLFDHLVGKRQQIRRH
jgi:hypothetical protein